VSPQPPFSWAAMDDEARKQRFLDWVVDTCLLFGTQRKTAYNVAGLFADGLDREAEPLGAETEVT
jgi:hypothetical protein